MPRRASIEGEVGYEKHKVHERVWREGPVEGDMDCCRLSLGGREGVD